MSEIIPGFYSNKEIKEFINAVYSFEENEEYGYFNFTYKKFCEVFNFIAAYKI